VKLLLLLFAGGLTSQAQSWDALHGLQAGEKIKVAGAAREEYQGRFQAFSERGISLETGKGVVEVERGRVRRVQVRATSRRLRNLLIGATIGAAVGIAVDQTVGRYLRNETGDQYRAVTYIAPIAVFAGIGAAIPGYRTVYRSQ
jgi:hypothetical protein